MEVQVYKRYAYDLVGAIHEVHAELGPGLNEYCYQEGLAMELNERGILFQKEVPFHPLYHGKELKAEYRLDFLCKDTIIVELKSVDYLTDTHRSQLFNYLRIMKKPMGILVNFSPKFAVIERWFYDAETKSILRSDGSVFRTGMR